MSERVTKLPGFPKPPSTVDAELRQFLEAIVEAIEIRLGRRGDPLDRAITLRELIDSGLAKRLAANPFDPNNPSRNPDFVDPNKAVSTDIPLRPTGFAVAGAYSVINLRWDFPKYLNHNQTEIWSHPSDSIGDATLAGIDTGHAYIDPVGSGVTRYYWIRHVNEAGTFGPWNATAGTVGQTATDVAHTLDVLTGAVTTSELATALNTQLGTYQNATQVNNIIGGYGYQTNSQVDAAITTAVGAIRGTVPLWSASGTYAVNEVVRTSTSNSDSRLYICIQAVAANTNDTLPTSSTPTTWWKLYGDYFQIEDSNSKITQVNLLNGSSTSAAAQAIYGLNSILKDGSGNVILSADAFSSMKTNLFTDADADPPVMIATAAQIAYLNASYKDPEDSSVNNLTMQAAMLAAADSTRGLRGEYTLKIDANGHVAGFGLANTYDPVADSSTSEFFVNADKFAILPDQVSTLTAAWASGTTYSTGTRVSLNFKIYQARVVHSGQNPDIAVNNNAATYWDNLSVIPFSVTTSGVTIDGTYVPAGVYINSAMIKHATITAAQIGSVNADTIDAGYIDADRIDADTITATMIDLGGSQLESRQVNGVYTLMIGAAAITTADIGDAQITTLKVAGNSITASGFAQKLFATSGHSLTFAMTTASNVTAGQPYIFNVTAIVNDTSANNAVLSPAQTYDLKITTYSNGQTALANTYWLYAYGTDSISIRRASVASGHAVSCKVECFVHGGTTAVPSCQIQMTAHTGLR